MRYEGGIKKDLRFGQPLKKDCPFHKTWHDQIWSLLEKDSVLPILTAPVRHGLTGQVAWRTTTMNTLIPDADFELPQFYDADNEHAPL